MESTFGIIMLGLDNNQPRVLNLKSILPLFLEYRKDVVIRRTRFQLKKAEERAHVLLGLKIAVENLDDKNSLLKKASSPHDAKSSLKEKYSLSEIQAQAILDLRLQKLTALERDKIINEYNDLVLKIAELKSILADDSKIAAIIKKELLDIKSIYGDQRRTEIVGSTEDIELRTLL
jgi:DNA gyrase subunit A